MEGGKEELARAGSGRGVCKCYAGGDEKGYSAGKGKRRKSCKQREGMMSLWWQRWAGDGWAWVRVGGRRLVWMGMELHPGLASMAKDRRGGASRDL